jgi:hypothetical protein
MDPIPGLHCTTTTVLGGKLVPETLTTSPDVPTPGETVIVRAGPEGVTVVVPVVAVPPGRVAPDGVVPPDGLAGSRRR